MSINELTYLHTEIDNSSAREVHRSISFCTICRERCKYVQVAWQKKMMIAAAVQSFYPLQSWPASIDSNPTWMATYMVQRRCTKQQLGHDPYTWSQFYRFQRYTGYTGGSDHEWLSFVCYRLLQYMPLLVPVALRNHWHAFASNDSHEVTKHISAFCCCWLFWLAPCWCSRWPCKMQGQSAASYDAGIGIGAWKHEVTHAV